VGEPAKIFLLELEDRPVEQLEEAQALRGDVHDDDAAVVSDAQAVQKAAAVEAVEQTRHVWNLGDQARCNFAATNPVGSRATQDTQDVELRGRNALPGKARFHSLHEHSGSALEIGEGLLFKGQGFGLADFLGEQGGILRSHRGWFVLPHGLRISVHNKYCQ